DVKSLMSFPPRIPGYSLDGTDSGFLLVDCLEDVVWRDDEAKDIFKDNEKIHQLLTIMRGFALRNQEASYTVKGKIEGLRVLLTGPAGSGKTLACKYLSEKLHLPLYRASIADFRSSALNIDHAIQLAFDRAARWKAIFLLDMADIFVPKRGNSTFESKYIASIFLKVLENYSGIAILVTDRPEALDNALYSRVHVKIEFPEPDQEEREKIWIGALTETNNTLTIEVSAMVDKLKKLELDGRRINNAVRVAKLFAKSR
ncbi:hypothetical protein M426DRAFT_39715, partial [Hypoxylon sp. CI-4A]